jgi:hypothetical protein
MRAAIGEQLSFRRNRTLGAAADHRCHDIGCIQQRLRSEMRITLGHAGLRMPEQTLHDVQRHTVIHQKGRERVPQVVKSNIGQTRALSDTLPLAAGDVVIVHDYARAQTSPIRCKPKWE